MEYGLYPLSHEDKAIGIKISTEKLTDYKYFTLTLNLYNLVFWIEYAKKVKELT